MSNLVTNYEDLGEMASFLNGKISELNTLYGDYMSKAKDILNKNKATTKNLEVLKDSLKYAADKYSASEENFKNTAKGDVVYGE